MSRTSKFKNNIKFDIVIVGAGPTGLAFACGFANTKIKIAIVDQLSKRGAQGIQQISIKNLMSRRIQ